MKLTEGHKEFPLRQNSWPSSMCDDDTNRANDEVTQGVLHQIPLFYTAHRDKSFIAHARIQISERQISARRYFAVCPRRFYYLFIIFIGVCRFARAVVITFTLSSHI